MELTEVVRRRRMVRSYDPERLLDDATVHRLLEAAVRAPSAGHSQGWDFLVLRSADERERFWAATAGYGPPDRWLRGLRSAPLLVVCLSDRQAYERRYREPDKAGVPGWPVPYWHVDTGMAALLMLLTAVDLGLGACFFGVPADRHDALLEAFDVPSGRTAVGVVSVGHPAPDRRSPSLRRGRRPLRDVAHAGRFGVPLE